MSASGCESIRPLISAFMDGELSPEEGRRLREHLDSCDACRQLFDDYRLVRDQMRQLPSDPQPPEDIAKAVWEHARRQQSRTGLARWIGMSGARFSLSVAAALAILVIASAFLLVRGYQQGATPGVAASQPAAPKPFETKLPTWSMTQPVRITFTKPMNHASVLANLKFIPSTAYNKHLPTSWDGNTLIIGASSTSAKNLMSDTDYTITILGSAQDAYGHSLGSDFQLKFHTSPTLAESTSSSVATSAASPTTPNSTPGETPQHRIAAVSSPKTQQLGSPDAATSQAIGTPSDDGTNTTSLPDTLGPTGQDATQTSTSGSGVTSKSVTAPVGSAATTSTAQPTPTPSPTPSPTATPTQTPTPVTTPQPTGVASETAPTDEASPESATPTSTPTPVPVTGAFGSVYWANQSVQDKLGAPDPRGQYTIIAEELPFQKGLMYDSRDQTSTIYVLTNGDSSSAGTYTPVKDTWQKGDDDPTSPTPPSSSPPLYIPTGNFGKVWQDQNLFGTIGWAVSDPAQVAPASVPIQQFADGLMLYDNQGFVYVLYSSDNTWEVYPDTSGHGDLIPTPTPTGSGTTTTTPTTTATPTGTPPTATPTAAPDGESDAASTSTSTPTTTPTP